MSNCVVRSRGSRLPGDVVAQHGVEGCDHLSHDGDAIEAIVFGEDAAGTGELTKFARIDASDGQANCEQSSDDAALVAAAGLDPDCDDRQSIQPLDQLGPPGGVVIHRKALPVRQHLDVRSFATSIPQ